MPERAILLYVDDEQLNLLSFKLLCGGNYTILTAPNAATALDLFRKNDITIVISDQKMPGMSGVALLDEIRAIREDTLRIIHSGYIDDPEVNAALERGTAHHLLDKPLNEREMKRIIGEYLKTIPSK
jgi:response regulator RpfG family c-di-GMP phosphodiesterase